MRLTRILHRPIAAWRGRSRLRRRHSCRRFRVGVLVLPALLASGAFAGCLPVTGNRILGSDLAQADPQFSALPSDLVVGFAPTPGARRIYSAAELRQIARANAIPFHEKALVCFELPMRRITDEETAAAMRPSLPANAELKVIELPKIELPAGQIEFPIEGLEPASPASPGVQLWRGDVRYAGTLKTPIEARVAINARFDAVVAIRDLPANSIVTAASLRIESHTGPLEREQIAVRVDEVSGRLTKRALKAGAWIPLAALTEPPEVRRGDPVTVDVQSGRAHLEFTAVAETSANEGEMVELRNPSSGKTFRGRLNPGCRVLLIVPVGQTL